LSGYGSAGDYTEAELDFLSFNVRLNGIDYRSHLQKTGTTPKQKAACFAFTWSFGEFTAHLLHGQRSLPTGMSTSPIIDIPEMRIEKGRMSPPNLLPASRYST